MAIIANQTSELGDVLYIETTVPAIGISALIGFTDDVIGETGSLYYNKKFRFSLNGSTWSEWFDLTLENIEAVDTSTTSVLFLQYRYEQVGSGNLSFNSNTVDATYDVLSCPFYFTQSIFAKYFSCTDIEIFKWYINVTEKLYTGELSKFVKFDDGNGDSYDSISFWQSIAKFFAFYVVLARTYKNFYQNISLLDSYLIQRGLFTSTTNTLIELNNLMKNFNNEISKRGTNNIFLTKENNNDKYDGELRRYLNLTGSEEFIVDQYLEKHCGWHVDESSPLYRGLEDHINANKFDFDNFSSTTDVTFTELDNDTFLNIVAVSSTEKGLVPDGNNLINISTKLNYVFDFEIEVLDPNTTISIGLKCYDVNESLMTNVVKNFNNDTLSELFLLDQSLERLNTVGGYFPIKTIIYNSAKPSPFSQDSLNILVGNNLKLNSNLIRKISPYLIIKNGEVNIKNFTIRPLSTDYERGFIQVNNFISMWIDEQVIY